MRTSYFRLCAAAFIGFQFLFGVDAWSFENAEHKYISNLALPAAAADGPAPDITKYQSLTLSWTYGINYFGKFYGNPAEQLAHLQNQSLSVNYTAAIDGGDFDQIRRNITRRYLEFNFNTETPGHEGAYVWLGAAMHLIEDQSSLPHAANIWHDLDDQFEGGDPELILGSRSSKTGGSLNRTSIAGFSADQAYSLSLSAAQDVIGSIHCSTSPASSCYLYNDLLNRGSVRYEGKPEQQAQFVGSGPCGSTIAINQICYDPSWYGDYGGQTSSTASFPTTFRQDIYSEALLGQFDQQGSQAAKLTYLFLLDISKSLPPLIKNLHASTQTVNPSSPMVLTFHAMDNRTQSVISSATILNQDGSQRLNSDGTHVKAFSDRTVSLAPNGADLPWETDASLPPWDGTLSDGTTLPNGEYQLAFYITDADGNSSPVDSSIRFSVIESGPPPGPNLSLADYFSNELYADKHDAVETEEIPGTVLAPNALTTPRGSAEYAVTFEVRQFGLEISSITISGPGGKLIPVVTSLNGGGVPDDVATDPLPDHTHGIDGFFSASTVGKYTMTATDKGGAKTVASFMVGTMSAPFDPGTSFANCNWDTGSCAGAIGISPVASFGVQHVQWFNYQTRASLSNGEANVHGMVDADFSTGVGAFLTDAEGNTGLFTVYFGSAAVSVARTGTQALGNETPTIYSGPGTHDTPPIDVVDYHLLPGAFAAAGFRENTFDHLSSTFAWVVPSARMIPEQAGNVALSTITIGHVTVSLTGGGLVYSGDIYYNGGHVFEDPLLKNAFRTGRNISMHTEITEPAVKQIPSNLCQVQDSETHCSRGTAVGVNAAVNGNVYGIGFSTFNGVGSRTEFAGGIQNASADAGLGVKISELNTTYAGSFDVGVGLVKPDPAYQGLPHNMAFDIGATLIAIGGQGVPFWSNPFRVTLNFIGGGLSAQQKSPEFLRLVRLDGAGRFVENLPYQLVGANQLTFLTNTVGRFMLLVPSFPDPIKITSQDAKISVLYDRSVGHELVIQEIDPGSSQYQDLLAGAAETGQIPLGKVYKLTPEDIAVAPAGAIRVYYDPAKKDELALLDGNLRLLELSHAGNPPVNLPGQFSDYGNPSVSAPLTQINSLFGVFGSTTPRPRPDTARPLTQIVFNPSGAAGQNGAVRLTTATEIGFTAVDPPVGTVSGVSAIYYAIDPSSAVLAGGLTGGTTGAFQVFAGTFTLGFGPHLVAYGAADYAGNYEILKSTSVDVAALVNDSQPPRTSLSAGQPSFVGDTSVYVTSGTPIGFYVVDDRDTPGDELGVGTTQTFYATDGGGYSRFASSFTLVAEGTHTLSFFSVDQQGRAEGAKTQVVGVDLTAPVVVLVSSGAVFSITAVDPLVNGAASGVAQIIYLVDVSPNCHGVQKSTAAPRGTCANMSYAGPFELAVGTHSVFYAAGDRVRNGEQVIFSSSVVVGPQSSAPSLAPALGPIGVPFSISGAGFGAYGGSATRVKFGTVGAPLSTWNDTAIAGTVPGLSTGAYAVTIERQDGSSTAVVTAGIFTVTDLSSAALSVSSGPIGVPFSFSGAGFGPYAGELTRVLVDGATAPLSSWTDTSITGTIPGLPAGAKTIVIQRATGDGGLSVSASFGFEVTTPSISAMSPAAGPIGTAFTLSGRSFGAYAGADTRVLFGGSPAALSSWSDASITGTVPALSTGAWSVVVERRQGSFISTSGASTFTVASITVATVSPSSAPIGAPFTLTGAGFGAYAGADTRVMFGGAVAALSLWNDTTITGTVPTLSAGTKALRVERVSGAGLEASATVYFDVVLSSVTGISPSSGPIGVPFTLTGTGFGPYGGANTYVLIGGATAALSVWNDTLIGGTVPGALTTGIKAVTVARVGSDGTAVVASAGVFQVTGMSLDAVSPGSGPIGTPFTITGTQFGAYDGSNTQVRFGGVSAALSAWNETTISGAVPGLSTGTVDVVVERRQGANVALSNISSFTIVGIAPASVSPSSGPIGTVLTITGTGFGPYAGADTRLLMEGTVVALSAWNETTIVGTVPGTLPPGRHPVWLERSSGAGVQSSGTGYFTITSPVVASLSPGSGPIGAPFTITGTSFGVYAGGSTRVRFGGVLAPLSAWSDTSISGTVPGELAPGAASVVVERAEGAGLSASATQAFLVVAPAISTVSPAFGPPDTVVTLEGTGFGPYAGSLTKVLVGGATVALSVWNDSTIHWTVPASLSNGEYPVIVERTPAGGTVDSASATFTVGTGLGGASLGFAAVQPLAAQPDSRFEGGMSLSGKDGGRIDTPAKAAVELPPNAMTKDAEITLKRLRTDAARTAAAESASVRAAGEPIEFGPEGTRFNASVTIELPYDPALTADESKVAVHYYNALKREWEALPSVVDRARHVVKAQTDHFSIYQPMGLAPTTVAQDEFYFRDQYVFPNPTRGGALVTFRVQPGLAETVEVRVYDVAGRKVHESSDFTFRGALDDGNGKGAQDTYDHAWSVGGVASGVYTYVVKASHGGSKPIVRSGKVGVIR